MPNRILKESICTSDSIDMLSPFEETMFYRLIVNCDDYGRMDARPKILAAKLFPLKDIRVKQIEDALRALTSAELVRLYKVNGKPFLQMNTWDRHQRVRNSVPKYPGPEQADDDCGELPRVAATCRESRLESNPIQSNPNPNTNPYLCTEQTDVGSVLNLPLNDGTMFGITQDQVDKWAGLYPAVDIMQELRNMQGWLDSNPKKRKTKTGILRFVNGWLSREQDKPHFDRQPHKKVDTKFHNFEQRDDDLDDYAFKKMMSELGEA